MIPNNSCSRTKKWEWNLAPPELPQCQERLASVFHLDHSQLHVPPQQPQQHGVLHDLEKIQCSTMIYCNSRIDHTPLDMIKLHFSRGRCTIVQRRQDYSTSRCCQGHRRDTTAGKQHSTKRAVVMTQPLGQKQFSLLFRRSCNTCSYTLQHLWWDKGPK